MLKVSHSIAAMIQQPRVPSSGQMPASDVLIRAKEVRLVNSAYSKFFEIQFMYTPREALIFSVYEIKNNGGFLI